MAQGVWLVALVDDGLAGTRREGAPERVRADERPFQFPD